MAERATGFICAPSLRLRGNDGEGIRSRITRRTREGRRRCENPTRFRGGRAGRSGAQPEPGGRGCGRRGACGRAGLRAKELASRLGHPAWRPAVAPKKVNLRKVSDHRRLKKKSKASGRRKKKTSKIGRSQRTEIKMALDFSIEMLETKKLWFATLKILSHKLSFFQLNVEKYKLPL